MPKDIRKNLIDLDASLEDVLSVLNQGVFGVVFVVDDQGVMQGLFTDGDVRRALLKGAALSEAAEKYMNRSFTAGKTILSRQENLRLLSETVRHLPILDDAGRPVDMVSWAEIWRLPVMEPSLGGNELKYVADCITSNWISSQGRYVREFERIFADYIGVSHALTTSNGTTAIHLALAALEIGPGDEVIVPDLTFAAPANVVIHCGATPVFVDVNEETWTIEVEEIEQAISENTKAIIPVHLYGHPSDLDPLMAIAAKYDLVVIEDCAEALGATYKGCRVGNIGRVGCYSFFANKIITTGEGGMVTTNDSELANKMAILRDHGMNKEKRYWHLYPGFNYRMTNLQAAIGLAQMERIDDFLSYRQEVVERYNQHLSEIPGIILPPAKNWATNIHWLYSIVVDDTLTGINRDELARGLAEAGIETRPFFYPLHQQPPYQPQDQDAFPVATRLSASGLSLPTANDIRVEDVDKVCAAIERIIGDSQLIREITQKV
ncbi:MAG: aminotransferase class I/II-fold pyridoxal phosphate-dependent enzyme [Candidatus Promineifilaceae bacterium]